MIETAAAVLLAGLIGGSIRLAVTAQPAGRVETGLLFGQTPTVWRTDHYEIHAVTLPVDLRDTLPRLLERAYAAYQNTLPAPVMSRHPIPIYLFADRRQWEQFTRSFAGSQAEVLLRIRQGAYCLNDACVAYHIGTTRTLAALAHEGWHQFVGRHFQYRLPSWLDEGMAMQFETLATHEGPFDPTSNGYRLRILQQLWSRGPWMALPDLLACSPGEVLTTDQTDEVLAFYSQAYALVQFLQQGPYAEAFRRMLWDGATGQWPLTPACRRVALDRNVPMTLQWNRQVGVDIFRHYIDSDLERADAAYRRYCKARLKATSDPPATGWTTVAGPGH